MKTRIYKSYSNGWQAESMSEADANGKPNNYIADGNDPNEDFVDSFYEVPSVFNSNNSNEMCGNCDTYFPVEQLCPVTHFCPKCQKEDREYEQQDMFANGD